ncbi:MAG: hypothetical protein ACFFAU_16325, partial [Candidatus Hodarchaeota archaeon]
MKRDQLVKIFLENDFNVAPDALDFLMKLNISEEYLREILNRVPRDLPVINRKDLEKYQRNYDQQFKQLTIENGASSEEISIDQKEIHKRIVIEPKKDIPEKISRIEPSIQRSSPKISIILDIPDRSSDKP